MPDPLVDFDRRPTSFGGVSYDVFVAGSGPAVVVLPEIPGITPDVAAFATRLVDAGFTVWMPSLFGTPGQPLSPAYALKTMAGACVQRQFLAFARGKRAPITDWLAQLVSHAHAESGGVGVGVVGMCFTGNFALALAVDPAVQVPVMSQPSLPFGISPKHRADLHVSPDALASVKRRAADDELCVIGLRFTADPLVPAARFERLRRELGDAFVGVEIDSSPGNPHGFGKQTHSVLTAEYRPDPDHPAHQAFDLVLDHFRQKLHA